MGNVLLDVLLPEGAPLLVEEGAPDSVDEGDGSEPFDPIDLEGPPGRISRLLDAFVAAAVKALVAFVGQLRRKAPGKCEDFQAR